MKIFGNLVRLLDLDEEFIIDLRYATPNNFTNDIVYSSPECYIDMTTAQKLIKAKNLFKKKGYGMKIWDAYRPVSAQKRFWELMPDNNFVAYPPDITPDYKYKNSHMNGQCVDVTLTGLDGSDVIMPSSFDDFSDRAKLQCPSTSPEARANGQLLCDVMVDCGFTPYINEWWHFVDKGAKIVPYSDYNFKEE